MFRDQFFGEFVGVHGVLARLFAEFMSSEMISFTVGDRCCSMGMSSKVMEFCDSIMQSLDHGCAPGTLDAVGEKQYARPTPTRKAVKTDECDKKVEVPADKINLDFVLGNNLLVGTVNANREYFESGVRDMALGQAIVRAV